MQVSYDDLIRRHIELYTVDFTDEEWAEWKKDEASFYAMLVSLCVAVEKKLLELKN